MTAEFVITVCLQNPHPPMVSTAEFREMYDGSIPLPDRTTHSATACFT
jgi:hypothetical protein